MSDISVSKVVKTTTDDKDSYDVLGDVKTRNEIRAEYLDLEEQGLTGLTFLQYLDAQLSVDETYEDNPEMVQAIRLHKHGYDFWGPRMQVYGDEVSV